MLAANSSTPSAFPSKPGQSQSGSENAVPIVITTSSASEKTIPSNRSVSSSASQRRLQTRAGDSLLLRPTANPDRPSTVPMSPKDKDFGTYGHGAPHPPRCDLRWRRFDPSNLPEGAFSSGVDSNGRPIYVIRAYHMYAYHIGSYSSTHGCKIPFNGKAVEPQEPEILTLDPDMVEWVMVNGPLSLDYRELASAVSTTNSTLTTSSAFASRPAAPPSPILPPVGEGQPRLSLDLYKRFQLPRNSVPIIGGRESHGTDLYIARCLYKGSWVSGKMSSIMDACHFAWENKELTEDQYQILCFKRF